MRIEDKLQRGISITINQIHLVNDKSVEDILLDLHNYAAIALMLIKE